MDKTLEQLIAERKKEAEDKRIGYKAYIVATTFGKVTSKRDDYYGGYTDHKWYVKVLGPLTITQEESEGMSSDGGFGGSSITIKYNDKVVFNDKDSYIPGLWEVELNTLFIEAADQIKYKRQKELTETSKRLAEEERDKRARWGL